MELKANFVNLGITALKDLQQWLNVLLAHMNHDLEMQILHVKIVQKVGTVLLDQ